MPANIRVFILAVVTVAIGSCYPANTFGQNPELRYQPAMGQQFAYEVDVSVDSPTKVTTLKGVIRYTVTAVSAEQLNLTYRGGLTEASKPKAAAGNRGRGPGFGPFGPGFGPPAIPDPFRRPTFGGRAQSTNQITITTRGNVLAMEGESQLPYLLGNASLLPFEYLPSGNERQWKYDSGISIEQKSESNGRPFGPFGPPGRFGPFGPSEDKRSQAGQESAEYAIQSQDEQKVAVKKTYRLHKPAIGEDPELEITGDGTWSFSRKDRLPESMDFKQTLVITEAQTKTMVPMTISYKRLTAEALAKMDQEAQQRLKELEQKVAADKQKAEAPLTPQEKQSALADLASSDIKKIDDALKFLRGKSVKDPDSEIAAAIEVLLKHKNPKVKDDAKTTLAKWSPEFGKKLKLNEAYAGNSPVESTDREVDSTTPLFVGQILQFQEHGSFWFAGEILELQRDGKVKIRNRGFGSRELTLARRNLQLAPDEVEQPNRPAPSSTPVASSSATRTWTDASGEHKIEAAYLGLVDGKVKLKKADGKEIAVPLDKLSAEDQQFVQKLQSTKKTPNPFD